MRNKTHWSDRLFRSSDALLAAALLVAALLGRGEIALRLYIALCAARLLALSANTALRTAFARQPSMRYVQGSVVLALLLQLPGAALAALLPTLFPALKPFLGLNFILCGLLLNIEHVFYEYLFAVGDGLSATLSRAVTAALMLVGLLLCAPAGSAPEAVSAAWLLIACGVGAGVSLMVSLSLGGAFRPKLNGEVLKCAPRAMLGTALFPALALSAFTLLLPAVPAAVPLFAGLAVYEPWRTPFRRAPSETASMNRALLILCAAAAIVGMVCGLALRGAIAALIAATCGAVILAALCAFAMYGNLNPSRRDA